MRNRLRKASKVRFVVAGLLWLAALCQFVLCLATRGAESAAHIAAAFAILIYIEVLDD